MGARAGPAIDVVVLAGGRSSRFGADKLDLLLDDVLATLPPGASVVCVGPRRTTRRSGVAWVRERPPLAGPLAAVAAGLALGAAPVVVLAGGDMPRVGLAVPALVAALAVARPDPGRPDPETGASPPVGGAGSRPADAAVLVDSDGRAQVLASAWRRDRLTARLAELVADLEDGVGPTGSAPARPRSAGALAGRPLRLLLEGTDLVAVTDAWGAARDVDTPDDLP